MWCRSAFTATSLTGLGLSGPRPRSKALDLPGALPGAVLETAGLALKPALGALPTHITRQEIAAGQALPVVSAGDWRDGAMRAARWIFPGRADLPGVALEHVDNGH